MRLIRNCVPNQVDEQIFSARVGLTAWVSDWYRLEE